MADQIPALPREISPDGRELWDWAGRLSEHAAKLDKSRRLRADLAVIGTRCGDCDKWMKSRMCPQEKNVNGHNRGPSMNGNKCGEYVETRAATERRERLQIELQGLQP